MTEKEVVREVLKLRGWTQKDLALKAGFLGQSNVTGLLNSNKNGIRSDKLYQLLHAMGCEIIVKDTETGKEWNIEL